MGLQPSSAAVSALRSLTLPGPAGGLEAILNPGRLDAPYAALVLHPHPLGGGTLHNKVVYHAMKVLNAARWGFQLPTLRFNFRGVGLSQGTHDGTAEAEDARAALDWLDAEYGLPMIVCGFSFGAAMGLRACHGPSLCAPDPRVLAFAALGLPLRAEGRDYTYDDMGQSTLPKLFLSGDQDQYAPADQLAQAVAAMAEPKQLVFLSAPPSLPDPGFNSGSDSSSARGVDHFFTNHLDQMQTALATWLETTLFPMPTFSPTHG